MYLNKKLKNNNNLLNQNSIKIKKK